MKIHFSTFFDTLSANGACCIHFPNVASQLSIQSQPRGLAGQFLHPGVELRLDFRVKHVAATNATTMTSRVIGLNRASRIPATTALNPVAWLVSTLTLPRMIETNSEMTNPINEKNIPRSITLTGRMFYSWVLQGRVNSQGRVLS